MAFSSSKLRGKHFEAALKAEKIQQQQAIAQEKFQAFKEKSHHAGVQLFEKSMRRFRSQLMWFGFNRWCRWLVQSDLQRTREYNDASPDTKRKIEVMKTVHEVQRIASQSAHDREIEERNQRMMRNNAEANAAAEAAANPVNALQVLQDRLAALFSDGAKRKARLRRLHNLISAASRGDADRVAELLDDLDGGKVDIDSQENDAGLCCLVVATMNGSLNVVKSCCRRGASLELTDESGCTPLMIATKQKAITLCRVLLDNGARVNACDHVGDTSLSVCVRHADGCPDKLLFLLLDAGANCEFPDSTLNTPLHVACTSVVRLPLLHHMLRTMRARLGNVVHFEKALTKCLTQRGETILMVAARYGHLESVQLILSSVYGDALGGKVSESRTDQTTMATVEDEDDDVLHTRITDVTDLHKESPLMAAAMRDEREMVKDLLRCEANTELVSDTGDTLRSLSSMFERQKILVVIDEDERRRQRERRELEKLKRQLEREKAEEMARAEEKKRCDHVADIALRKRRTAERRAAEEKQQEEKQQEEKQQEEKQQEEKQQSEEEDRKVIAVAMTVRKYEGNQERERLFTRNCAGGQSDSIECCLCPS